MNDLVSDALIRIKNGYMASKPEVTLAYSKFVKAVCEVLKKEGYIADFKESQKDKESKISEIVVNLKYENEPGSSSKKKPALTQIQKVSKPGLRVYKGKSSLPYVLNGMGMAIVSTPKGVMTDKQARKEGVGGEIVAYVW
ncbi:30S ribosomal protein S8 [Candidatus Daviesbacteria bacterium]|nr:30S ribosomal protein S8 [Candidatus Daviesbacteria bacterium]